MPTFPTQPEKLAFLAAFGVFSGQTMQTDSCRLKLTFQIYKSFSKTGVRGRKSEITYLHTAKIKYTVLVDAHGA